jgi:hypothetical protein
MTQAMNKEVTNKRMANSVLLATTFLLLSAAGLGLAAPTDITVTGSGAAKTRPEEIWLKQPLSFEPCQRQLGSSADFVSRGSGYTVSLTSGGVGLVLCRNPNSNNPRSSPAALRMELVGNAPLAKATPMELLTGKANYFIGNEPAKWRTSVPTYAKVKYENIYHGIDLVYYGNRRQLEFDFLVAPGADPQSIALSFRGADKIELDKQGNLVVSTAGGQIVQQKPRVYQEIDGARHEIAGAYVINDGHQVSFGIAPYDHTTPLVIDPTLSYATYLGGSGFDRANGIAVDTAGNVYVVGETASTDFTNNYAINHNTQVQFGVSEDAFVIKLSPEGVPIYSTLLGGVTYASGAAGVAVDTAGNVYVTGDTGASDFPIKGAVVQGSLNKATGVQAAFIAVLNPQGSDLVYSTFLGGSDYDHGLAIAVDTDRNAYVTGVTKSGNFRVVNALQTQYGGGQISGDAFVAKINASGTTLIYSTYLGGSSDEDAEFKGGIAVDTSGNAYVTGSTKSTDFTPLNAFQPQHGLIGPGLAGTGQASDAFLTKISPVGRLVYSTYLGGNSTDYGYAVAVDGVGSAYVAGRTLSCDFPFQMGAIAGGGGAFVTKFSPDGSSLLYSTYLGDGTANAIAVNKTSGDAYVTGAMQPPFLTWCPDGVHPAWDGGTGTGNLDPFVAELAPDGGSFIYATYLGGTADSAGTAIGVDGAGSTYVAGYTAATDFQPVSAFQPGFGGGSSDAFVVKIDASPACPPSPLFGPFTLAVNDGEPPVFLPPNQHITISAFSLDYNFQVSQAWMYISFNTRDFSGPFSRLTPFESWYFYTNSIVQITGIDDGEPFSFQNKEVTLYVHVVPNIDGVFQSYIGFFVTPFPPTYYPDIGLQLAGLPAKRGFATGDSLQGALASVEAAQGLASDWLLLGTGETGTVDYQEPNDIANLGTAIQPLVSLSFSSTTTCSLDNIIVPPDPGQLLTVVNYPMPCVADNCKVASFGFTPPSGSAFPTGTSTVTCFATDISGNTATTTFTVTVAGVATPNVYTPLTQAGNAAVWAIDNNTSTPSSLTMSVATYTGNPTKDTISGVGGGYVDLKITGADAAASATVIFYYPSSVTASAEASLTLFYYNGTKWLPVRSSGGVQPVKDTTDNLPPVPASGGSFTVVFDNTSTPKITELNGTVFAMALPDTGPPVIQCPPNIVASTDPGKCSALVTFNVTATDNSGAVTVVNDPPSGTAFPKGTTTVNCTATDGSANQFTCSFTVTVNDVQKPSITCPADLLVGSLADVPAPNIASVIAQDNCPGVTVAWVSDTAPSDGSCGGTIVRTYVATDTSGNQAIGTQRITVLPQLAFSDEHAAVHYHNQSGANATAQNPAYTKAEVHGVVEFCDPGQISDGILSSLNATQVGAHVRAILGGIVIADTTFTMSVAGDQRQAWEADLGNGGPVRSLKVHWQGALRFTDEDSNPTSPKISSTFIGLSQSNLRYEAKAGTYTTSLPNGVSVVVTSGKITAVTGLDTSAYEIRGGQIKVDLELPYRLVPGMVMQTTGGIQDTITTTDDLNYWTEQGKYELFLQSNGLTQLPLFDALPDSLEYEITLGTGAGEHPAFGRSMIAAGNKPWSQEQDNHKLFNDDATD